MLVERRIRERYVGDEVFWQSFWARKWSWVRKARPTPPVPETLLADYPS